MRQKNDKVPNTLIRAGWSEEEGGQWGMTKIARRLYVGEWKAI